VLHEGVHVTTRTVLLTGEGYLPDHFDRLRNAGYAVIHEQEASPERLRALLPSIDAHVLGGSERLDGEVLDLADRLRVVSFVGTGIGAFVDVGKAAARGIRLCTTRGMCTRAVAEHTIGLLLGLVRELFSQNESVKRLGACPGETQELGAMVVGILGMGDVARQVARVLTQAFGCPVIYANRTRRPEIEAMLGVRHVDVPSLFAEASVILVLLSATAETKSLVTGALLGACRPGSFLLNTAGASIVDPTGLREALVRGPLRAAAFDGYWIEPVPAPADDPFGLLTLPDEKFIVTPHLAAKTRQAWTRMVDRAVEQVVHDAAHE
jgi:phosphoglycerate dehydrogenase-like enzyme